MLHIFSHDPTAQPTTLAMVACVMFPLLAVSLSGPILPRAPDEVADTARHLTVDVKYPAYASTFLYSKSEPNCKAVNSDIASAIARAFESGDTKHKTVSAGRYVTGRSDNVDVCHAWLLDEPTPAAERAVAIWIVQSHHLEVQAVRAPAFFNPR